MKSNYKKLGDYIRPLDNRNSDLKVTLLRGVSTSKVLIRSVANVTNIEFSSYKVVKTNQFVYVSDTSRRGDKIGLALNTGLDCIVSSIYTVFEVKNHNQLIPEFLMLWLKRPEFDRYTRYHSWGSARETFNWDDMCNVELPIPEDIDDQKSIVAAYNGLLKNQNGFENSFDDLQLICDTFIENLIKTEKNEDLGGYIEKIIQKNSDDSIKEVVGISERKEFRMPSGKVNKENLSNHLIVRKHEFAYIPRMNPFKPLAVALSKFNYPVVVSASYVAFKIVDTEVILPEFLLLFLKRAEFDRYAAFNAWSSTRDTFDWADMCAVKLPIPDIKTQKSIVAIHHALESRKRINEGLKNMITPLCPILMKGVIDNLAINLL